MNLLAVDTAANLCAVAVCDAATGRILADASEDIGRGHAERLMPMIDAVLRQAATPISAIGKIAVAVGPGSFTGIRVGVATARGLALALGVPAVGVSTLEILAADARKAFPGREVLAAVDARRGEIYAQRFDAAGLALDEPRMTTLEALADELRRARLPLVAGSAAPLLAAACGEDEIEIASAHATAPVAVLAGIGAAREAGAPPAPLYLRAPDAKPQAGFAVARSVP